VSLQGRVEERMEWQCRALLGGQGRCRGRREGRGRSNLDLCLGIPSFFVSKSKRTRENGLEFEERAEREGEVVGQGCLHGWFAKRGKKEKRRRRKETFGQKSFEFLKNSKSGPSSGGGLLRCGLQVVEVFLPSF
jgi:hypothetical protein